MLIVFTVSWLLITLIPSRTTVWWLSLVKTYMSERLKRIRMPSLLCVECVTLIWYWYLKNITKIECFGVRFDRFEEHRAVMGRDMIFHIVWTSTNVYAMRTFQWRSWRFEHCATIFQMSANPFLAWKCPQTILAVICTWNKTNGLH